MPGTLQALNAQRNYLESILQDLHGLTYGNGLVGFLLIQEVRKVQLQAMQTRH